MAGAPGLGPMEMTVVARDGLVLKGVLEYPDGGPGEQFPLAVLAHQYPATAESYAPLVEDLLELGVATLAFDLRGHGSSTQTPQGPLVIDSPSGFTLDAFGAAFMSSAQKVGFAHIADDVVRVAAWGSWQNYIDRQRLLLVGASVGGTGVLLAAPQVCGLRGLITFGAAGAPAHSDDAADRIRRNVRSVDVPFLLTGSERDPFDAGVNARAWTESVDRASTSVVPGEAHAMAIYYDVRDDVLAFVRRVLAAGDGSGA